ALAALPVGGVHAGGAHLDGDLPGSGRRRLPLDQPLALRAAVGGDDEDHGHGGLLREGTTAGTPGGGHQAAPTVCGARAREGTLARRSPRAGRRRSRRIALTMTRRTEPSWTSMPTAMVTPPANTPASSAITVIRAIAMFCLIT